ncbi:hypothetical protein NPIL_250861 [Nephila pilipes]|uniref:Uncharacterized protein n=1 Tax=Nephila pilipes TaxID=299642 RepID=A0A8X6PEK1_NEPPI|nr:hypothetical protein NPIL_250861 [Nephila pilipes]
MTAPCYLLSGRIRPFFNVLEDWYQSHYASFTNGSGIKVFSPADADEFAPRERDCCPSWFSRTRRLLLVFNIPATGAVSYDGSTLCRLQLIAVSVKLFVVSFFTELTTIIWYRSSSFVIKIRRGTDSRHATMPSRRMCRGGVVRSSIFPKSLRMGE